MSLTSKCKIGFSLRLVSGHRIRETLLGASIFRFVKSSYDSLNQIYLEDSSMSWVVNCRKASLCLGFSSLLFVDTSLFETKSKIFNVVSLPLLMPLRIHSTVQPHWPL